MNKHLQKFKPYVFLLLVCLGLNSCVTLKQIKYFQDIPDSTRSIKLKLANFVPVVVHPADVLSITILTLDPTATASVNLANSATISDLTGYMVDKDGNIEMPELGKIKVDGLTTAEVKNVVTERAKLYFTNPTVIVKNKNIKITVLGEVAKPGVVNSNMDKVTIIDLLGMTGELTNYAKRDNIMLLRQNDDNSFTTVRLNLKSSNIIKSPYYYLQNNDVLYFEPTKGKAISSDVEFGRNLQYLTLFTTLITTVLFIFKR